MALHFFVIESDALQKITDAYPPPPPALSLLWFTCIFLCLKPPPPPPPHPKIFFRAFGVSKIVLGAFGAS